MQNRRTRNCNRSKAVLLVLNFAVAKALVPEMMLAAPPTAGSLRHLPLPDQQAAIDRQQQNIKMLATVIYWCCRKAMAAALPEQHTSGQLHTGDGPVLEKLFADAEQSHVLQELQRIRFLDDMAQKLLAVADMVWEKAKPDS